MGTMGTVGRGIARLLEELELFDWYVRETPRARDDVLRTVLGDHLAEVRGALVEALDSLRSELGRRS